MADELVSLLVTFCIASTMASYSHGLLPSLLASRLEMTPDDNFNGETLSNDLELTTSDASWTTAATDMMFRIDSTAPNLASTTTSDASDDSWSTAVTETALRKDITVAFSANTAERTMPYTFWATEAADRTHSTRTVGTWSAWSTCSSPCDGGLQSRVRVTEMTTNVIIQEESEIDTSNSRLCNTNFCQVDSTEESYGVYIDLRTTLSTEQYVQVRNRMRAGVGWEIIRFCNSSINFKTCCAGQTLRAPLQHSQTLLDSIVVKRAASPQNNTEVMRLFLVVTVDAVPAICQLPNSSATTATHSAVRRSMLNEQHYMEPEVMSRLLESGSLAQALTSAIENYFPNVTAVALASRTGATTASLPEAYNVTSAMVKTCGALMELSQKDQQCVYSTAFFIAVASPNVAFLIFLVAILSVYKLRRRRFYWTRSGGGDSISGNLGQTQNITKAQTNSEQRRRYVHLALSTRAPDARHAIVKQDSLTHISDSSGNLNSIYENVTTFQSGSRASEPAVAAAAAYDASHSRPLPLQPPPLTECGADDADVYVLPLDQPMNSMDLQTTSDLPLARQQLAKDLATVASDPATTRALSKRLTQDEYVYIVTEAAASRPAASRPAAALPDEGVYHYAMRMSEIENDYANIVEEEHKVRHSVLADGNVYVAMG